MRIENILHSKAVSAPSAERDKISDEVLTFLSSLDPSLRLEAFGFGEDFRVHKHDVGGHADWRL